MAIYKFFFRILETFIEISTCQDNKFFIKEKLSLLIKIHS